MALDGQGNSWFTDLTGDRGPEPSLQDPCGPSEDLGPHPAHYTSSQRIGHPDFSSLGPISLHPFALSFSPAQTDS